MNAPLDMTKFIEAKSDQLNADDLLAGPRTIVIRKVSAADSEQPVNVFYEGDDNKPFRPCKTIRRVMVALWGRDAQQYVGRAIRLYRDPEVAFGGMKVGGIRVSHMSHIDGEQTVVVMKTKGKRAPMKIQPLRGGAEKPAPEPKASAEAPTRTFGGAAPADDATVAVDPRLAKLYEIKAALNAAATQDDLTAISEANGIHYNAMTPEQQCEITDTFGARWEELA